MVIDPKNYGDGFSDGFEPLVPMDVAGASSVSDLLARYARTAFGGRSLGEGADTLETMLRDPECLVVCTVSGAMTVAKMGLVLCDMIDRGWIHAVISTGALMAHGFVEATGRSHFKYDQSMADEELYAKGYDRVYDTLELEQNLDEIDFIVREVVDDLPEDTHLSSNLIMRALGRFLNDNLPAESRAILRSAYRMNVPIFVPAFTDSEMGLDVELLNQLRMRNGKTRRPFDPFLDLEDYARLVSVQKNTGIFTIGGGVPRNWAQQLGPLLDHLKKRTGRDTERFRFRYGVRICPEPVHWGGLSGCTYSEGITWGKFIPPAEGGRFTEILCDATIAWPLLVRGVLERVGDAPLVKNLRLPSGDTDLVLAEPELAPNAPR